MIEKLIKKLKLPENEVLFLHVRLKGISNQKNYVKTSLDIIHYLNKYYEPKTILIPTFTYSFTKSGIFDRVSTVSEVGRFSEESRGLFDFKYRTINPVFSVIDTKNYFENKSIENTAFGLDSIFEKLHQEGHVIVNINLDNLIATYFHYIEYKKDVDYRFLKTFKGEIKDGLGNKFLSEYEYHVRRLDMDTNRRYLKIEKYLSDIGILNIRLVDNVKLSWVRSKDLFIAISEKLKDNQRYMITD